MRKATVYIAFLFAWAVMIHPLAHAFDRHDVHLGGLTTGQVCEFCHSNAGIEAPVVVVAPTQADFEVAAEPPVSARLGHKLRPCGRAPPSSSC